MENLPAGDGRLEFLRGDIRQPADVRAALSGVDAIAHLAAVASVQLSVEDPVAAHSVNFDGTLGLLEGARKVGVRRVVYASSAAVYGDARDLPVTEGLRLGPLTPYAADKLAGEHYLDFYCRQFGFAASAFRFFNVYGPRQDPGSPYSGVISIFMDRARRGVPVRVYGDGRQTRDFVYVDDVVAVLKRALLGQLQGFRAVNVGTGREQTLEDLLAVVESLYGRVVERSYEPARPGDIRRSVAAVDRLGAEFGPVPATTLAEGLAALAAYTRDGGT
jgi:UDP-glucose 4-epimerase